MTALLRMRGVSHSYGRTLAVDRVSLDVADGEFLTILGPSGSGKTTLLRVVGGFEEASQAEEISIAGQDMRGLPPNHRPVSTVFQHYALFPHMSVAENVAYGLKLKGLGQAERAAKAAEALALVRLDGKGDRRIHQLSGGERQRVAFARAFVVAPRVLLLDEPMGALDEKLRRDMEIEVRQLQRRLGTTFIQVTHSQEEALTMSDRIAVMNQGRVEQLGSPSDVFERPATRFVADFMGLRNVLSGTVEAIDGARVAIGHAGHRLWGAWSGAHAPAVGDAAFLAVHPSRVTPGPAAEGRFAVAGRVAQTVYKGAEIEVEADSPLGRLVAALPRASARVGEDIVLGWNEADAVAGPASLGAPETAAMPDATGA
jgi:ABC-type Fe3+/spermidine/putrescine transport system ATPase subunit